MRHLAVLLVFLVGVSLFGKGYTSSDGQEDIVRVDFKQGSIETVKTVLNDGTSFYSFKGIPFAQPPVGNLRFKNPVASDPWSGVKNGSVSGDICPQLDFMAFMSGEVAATGNEDCLYLDVHTPKPHSSGLPVMVFIHGGGFFMGSAKDYSPDHLMTKDVVIVQIQYRLGIFAFLSTEDEVMSGNYGLKDQVMALRWVQENIEAFGGDRNRVTIFGESAGAISVHYLMASPMSEGLFHRAIAQSGTIFIANFIRSDHRARAQDLWKILECPGSDSSAFDSQALFDCLQNIPVDTLTTISGVFKKSISGPEVMMPSVDGEFFPKHPAKLIQEGNYHRVNFMTGINKNEGAMMMRMGFPNPAFVDSLAQNFSTAGPLLFMLDPDVESDVYIAKRLFYHYVGDIQLTEENVDDAEKMMGDLSFNIPLDLTGMMHARDVGFGINTYLYELHHLGEFKFMDSPAYTFGKHWVNHGDEIQYLFSSPLAGSSIAEPINLFLKDIMVNLWTNFAATGNPTPDMSLGFKWDPLSNSELSYLILQPSPYMRGYTRAKEMEFMMNLPMTYNKMLFPERFKPEV